MSGPSASGGAAPAPSSFRPLLKRPYRYLPSNAGRVGSWTTVPPITTSGLLAYWKAGGTWPGAAQPVSGTVPEKQFQPRLAPA